MTSLAAQFTFGSLPEFYISVWQPIFLLPKLVGPHLNVLGRDFLGGLQFPHTLGKLFGQFGEPFTLRQHRFKPPPFLAYIHFFRTVTLRKGSVLGAILNVEKPGEEGARRIANITK
jgi:hypothetical protein